MLTLYEYHIQPKLYNISLSLNGTIRKKMKEKNKGGA